MHDGRQGSILSFITKGFGKADAQFGNEHDAFFKELIDHHTAIYDAIEAKDPEAASAAMRVHLSRGLVVNRAVRED